MAKVVRVAVGYSNVPLPDGKIYNQGQTATLTDQQFAEITQVVLAQIEIIGAMGKSFAPPLPGPQNQQIYTNQVIAQALSDLSVPVVLTWDGVDYQPAQFKSTVNRQKTFIGPVDPSTVLNVDIQDKDVWLNG